MDVIYIHNQNVDRHQGDHSAQLNLDQPGYYWIDIVRDDIADDPEVWCQRLLQFTGAQLFEPHLRDAINPAHPSLFEATQQYGMLVFRKLAPSTTSRLNISQINIQHTAPFHIRPETTLRADADLDEDDNNLDFASKMQTQPVTFFIFEKMLLTIRDANCPSLDDARQRLMEQINIDGKKLHTGRMPDSPQDLLLRILNGMVDQYLALRAPLTRQLDRWQRALLDPRRPFKNWLALLDARIQVRKLEALCEEQYDSVSELKDYMVDGLEDHPDQRRRDLQLVRVNDVMEHITRVLSHARRMEESIESAVQIHFSAVSHRTNQIMRTLTVITALFMPLTLITGIFGMNFESMPFLKNRDGFWLTMISMFVIVVLMLAYFKRRSYLEDNELRRPARKTVRKN